METSRHKWMYSFLPSKEALYMLAYCPQCRQAATVLLDHTYARETPVFTNTNIPKYGCDNSDETEVKISGL